MEDFLPPRERTLAEKLMLDHQERMYKQLQEKKMEIAIDDALHDAWITPEMFEPKCPPN